jgi:antitoxin (DNA-binding transcriptional repressor) of toxin-antitoxin stability system
MARHIISATEASRSLSDVLNKVHYQGITFEIRRGKETIARISPATPKKHTIKISELNDFIKRLPSLEKEDIGTFEEDLRQIKTSAGSEDNPWE